MRSEESKKLKRYSDETLYFSVTHFGFFLPGSEEKTIVGSWELKELQYGTGAEIIDDKDDFECTLSFDKNGRYREWINGRQIDDRYLLTDDHLILLINSKTSDSLCYAYHLDGKKLILDEADRKGSLMCDEGC